MYDESLLLYARAYDLVEDHTSISPLSFICLPYDAEEEATNTSALISSLLDNLPFRGGTEISSSERLEATKDVSSLLSKTISLRNYTESPEDGYKSLGHLRLEEPLLQYPTSSPTGVSIPKLDLKGLPLEEAGSNDDYDEGLQFPAWAWERRNEIMEDFVGERMAIDRRVLEYLRKTVKDSGAHELKTAGEYDGEGDVLCPANSGDITPPLSPLPTPPTLLFPLPLNELAEQLEPLNLDLEDRLAPITEFGDDGLWGGALDEARGTSQFLESIQRPPLTTLSPVKSPAQELRIEAPLTPPFTSPSIKNPFPQNSGNPLDSSPSCRPAKRVKFSDIVEEFIIPPSLDPSEDGYDNEEIDQDDSLTKSAIAQFTFGVMEPGAQFFLMKLQQEQLEDSTKTGKEPQCGLRVELPILGWQRPIPPWVLDIRPGETLKDLIDKKVMEKWEYRKSLDIAGLCWTIGTMVTPESEAAETIIPKTEEELWEQVEEAYPVFPLETVIEDEEESFWEKAPQEDEQLECAKIEPKTDLDSLIERKRLRKPTTNSKHPISTLLDPQSNLSSFLALQDYTSETHFQVLVDFSSAPASPILSVVSCSQTNPSTIPLSILPSPVPPDPSSTFIISASFLANRALYKIIRSLCPTSKFVERDFETFSRSKLFRERDQVPNEYALEADIIVSPLVGLVLTDLQTIRRRPLPADLSAAGNSSSSTACEGIRDRISELSGRYQKLVVGVSVDFGGTGKQPVELGTADCAILAAFIGFCESIGGTEVAVVPAGGGRATQEMGKWMVETMGFYSIQWRNVGLEVEVTERESMWEKFLRNGGMNSYAAQAVLNKLHESGCGLVDFVTIEKESRKTIFEQFVGRKVLERFEEVVGADWQYI
ncbi:hypothetical protein TWF281_007903 [Arthrobotrys megalospora]